MRQVFEDAAATEERVTARLACALVRDGDELPDGCTLEDVVAKLSPRDRLIIGNIVRRIAALERQKGAAAAARALDDVVAVLAQQRGLAS